MNIIMLDCSNPDKCFFPKEDEKKLSFDFDTDGESCHVNLKNSYGGEKNGIYMLFIATDNTEEYIIKMNYILDKIYDIDPNYQMLLLVNIMSKEFDELIKHHCFACNDKLASIAVSGKESDQRNFAMFTIIKKKLEYNQIKDYLTENEKYEYIAQI